MLPLVPSSRSNSFFSFFWAGGSSGEPIKRHHAPPIGPEDVLLRLASVGFWGISRSNPGMLEVGGRDVLVIKRV